MATRYFAGFQRGVTRDQPFYDPHLPSYSSAVREKLHLQSNGRQWLVPMTGSTRRIRLQSLSPEPRSRLARVGRRRGFVRRCVAFLIVVFAIAVIILMLLGTEESHWTPPFRDSTLVFGRENLQRIWKWEIESGHYPSNGKSKRQRAFGSARWG
jgi:WD repeat and SOF domain-containing protein 1